MMPITFKGCMLYLSVSAVIITLVAVTLDFSLFGGRTAVRRSQKSIVATGSMLGFSALYFIALLLTKRSLDDNRWMFMGTLCIVSGACINVAGRLTLGKQWANHIKIYDGHRLVDSGVFTWVRHPLYASIMLMLFGGSVLFQNLPSALLTLCIFIPFMYYRARQEELLLRQEVSGYTEYMARTGMFLPRLPWMK
ncbi:MAG: isoprenylcysteine carboxylmethyltransferase family protein [Angelakisella sp.]